MTVPREVERDLFQPGTEAIYRNRRVTVLQRTGKGYRVRFADTGGHTRANEHGLTLPPATREVEGEPTAAERLEHKIRWYGISGSERIPRNRHMRGKDWGWDAMCSCGWESRTGGAIQERVREAIEQHRRQAHDPRPTV